MIKPSVITILSLGALLILVFGQAFFSISCTAASDQETKEFGHIENLNILIVFDRQGNARIAQKFIYVLDTPLNQTILIPLWNYKLVLKNAPLWLSDPERIPLSVKNIMIKLHGEAYFIEKNYSEALWQKIPIVLTESRTSITISYDVENAIVQYPLFSHYETLIEVAGSVPITNCTITLVIEGVSMPEPASYFYVGGISSGAAFSATKGAVTRYFPFKEIDFINDTVIGKWSFDELNNTNYPLSPYFIVSPIPGLSLFGWWGVFASVSALVAILFFEFASEFAYYAGIVWSLPARGAVYRFSALTKANLPFIAVADGAFYLYSSIYWGVIGGNSMIALSWAYPVFGLVWSYWLITLFMWPIAAVCNYFNIQRRHESLKLVIPEKLILWVRGYPLLLFTIFLHMLASINFIFGIYFLQLYIIPQSISFVLQLWYPILSLIPLLLTSFSLFRRFTKLLDEEGKVYSAFRQLYRGAKESISFNDLVTKCETELGIPPHRTKLMVDILSKLERLIIQTRTGISEFRRIKYELYLGDDKADRELERHVMADEEKLRSFKERTGIDIRPATTPQELREKMGRVGR